MIDALKVMPVFDFIKENTGLDIHVSTMGINIQDSLHGQIKGYYGFYSRGAIRVDANNEGDIVQIAIWKSPGDLNQPDIKIDTSHDNIENQFGEILRALKGDLLESSFVEHENLLLMTEGVKDDLGDFISENPDVLEIKNSEAFKRYLKWATENGRKVISQVYFNNTFKLMKEMPSSSSSSVEGDTEETIVFQGEEDTFVKDIMENEIFYKAAMYENILRRMAKDDPGIVSLFVYGSPGLGKGSANSSLINTPKGRIPMGNLKVGDYITTPKGSESKILEVHPLGKRQIFQVELSDGARAYVTEDHLWRVKRMDETISRAKKKFGETLPRRWDLLTTKEMMELGLKSKGAHGKWRFAIPYITSPYEIKEPFKGAVDPYLLGSLLGDGGLSTKSGINFSSKDSFIADKLNAKLKNLGCKLVLAEGSDKDYRIVKIDDSRPAENILNTLLKDLGLKEIKSFNKFIPKDYMLSSAQDRVELLQGLMDTDGSCIRARGHKNIENFWVAQFYTVSPQLKEDVIELVRSLGGRASCVKKSSRYKDTDGNIVECQDHYRLTISFIDSSINPFSLPRKAEKYSPCKNTTRTIREISPVYFEEATCILIDDPDHLYVADDYVVTHNTYLAKKILREEGIWESKVVYKSGSIAGFTGLLQLLWDNRKGKIIVLDDNDSILVGNIAASNILKACLNTDPEDRVVSYTKFKR